jgi:hypothetical protein
MSDVDRFWSHVSKRGPNDCWLWTAATTKGYGSAWYAGRREQAHRVSFMMANCRWPAGLVMHLCDMPACVNPAHLAEGTQRDNMQGCRERGRLNTPIRPRKVACPAGHQYAVDGRWRADRNHPVCRICENARDKARNAIRRLKSGAPVVRG